MFLLSINSFAAVVADNDGSAFVTKSEFEVLKKNFNDQIDKYNNSIDNKIDGAIASYLQSFAARKQNKKLLFEIDGASSNNPICVPNGYNTIEYQTFQSGQILTNFWSTLGLTLYGLQPMQWRQADGNYGSDSYGVNWSVYTFNNKSPYDQMVGWVFDEDDNTQILKYNYDNLSLRLTMSSTQNINLGKGGNSGDRWHVGIHPGTLTGKKVGINYNDSTGIGHGTVDGRWVFGMDTTWFDSHDTLSAADYKTYWENELPFLEGRKDIYDLKRNDGLFPKENVPTCSYYMTHNLKNQDTNIYVYNKCNDVIYAHGRDAVDIEEYVDYMDKINTLPDAATRTIGGTKTNLFVSPKTERWIWCNPKVTWSGGDRVWDFDRSVQTDSMHMSARRTWRFTPKFKLKNTSTVVPPTVASVSGGTSYWNTLDKFKNKLLSFSDYNGNDIVPYFYGGYPLCSLGNDTIEEMQFDLNINRTTSTGTLPTMARVQIKYNQFPNESNTSSWTQQNIDELIEFDASNGSNTYNYDKTNNYLKIPLNETVKITIKEPKKNNNLFIRWWEDGNVNNSGGQLVRLNNCIILS